MTPSAPQLLILLFLLVFPVLLFGPVLKKAGFSIWWALLMALPLVNIGMIWVFAFIEWPIDKND